MRNDGREYPNPHKKDNPMNLYHCNTPMTLTHDNRIFVRRRCQVCKCVQRQNKRLPANAITPHDKLAMIGAYKREIGCSLLEAKNAVEQKIIDQKLVYVSA